MGMYFLLYLTVYFATNLLIVVSSDVGLKADMNLSALTSLLIAVNSSISKYLTPSKFIRVSFTPSTPTQLYSQSSLSLRIENDSGFIYFSYVFLDSSEFLLLSPVKLDVPYPSPYTLNLTFNPSLTGVRTAYLLVKIQSEFIVYYLQGISEDNKYGLQPVSYKVQGEIYGQIKLTNPENANLTVLIELIEGFPPNSLEIMAQKHVVSQIGVNQISLFKVKNKLSGRIKGKIWIWIEDQKFYLPVLGSRKTHQVDCGEIFDLGILTMHGKVFSFDLKCEKDPDFVFKYRDVQVSDENAWIRTRKVQEKSNHFLFGVLFVRTDKSGSFLGSVRVDCENETFVIYFKYVAVFDVVETDIHQLYFPNILETNRSICVKNNLNHEIWIKKFISSSDLFSILTDNYFFSSQDSTCFQIKTRPVVVESFTLSIESNIGRLVFPLYSTEPFLDFYTFKDKKLQEVFGPVDLGNIGLNLKVEKQILIRNPYPIPITLYSIQSIPNVSIKYSMNTQIPAYYSFNFTLSIKSDISVYGPLKIATSIGAFSLSIHTNVLVGWAKVKNIVISSIYPKQHREEAIVLVNNYSVPIKVYAITVYGENLSISKDVIEVPEFSQQTVGKVKASVKLHEKTNVDFKKSVTYADIKRTAGMAHYEGSNRSYEAKIFTDLAGELIASVTLNVKKPALIVTQHQNASICLMKTDCLFKITVRNPIDSPIRLQVYTIPDNYLKTLKKIECLPKKKLNEHNDEEFENLAAETQGSLCEDSVFPDHEEIKQIKQASEKRLSQEQVLSSLSLLEKILKFIYHTFINSLITDTKLPDPEDSAKAPQSIFLLDSQVLTIPGHSSRTLGPFIFSPQTQGRHTIPIMLKNNYTIIETVDLHFNSSIKKLAITKKSNYNFNDKYYTLQRSLNKKDFQKLPFEVSPEEISRFFINYATMHTPVIFKTFDLQNVGTVDIEVRGVYLNDFACKSRGFEIGNCAKDFVLRPGDIFTVEVSFNLLESWNNDCSKLLVLTDSEEFAFAIDTYLVEGLNLTHFLYVWAEVYYLLCTSFTLGLVVACLRHGLMNTKRYFDVRTTKDVNSAVFQQYFCKKYSQPIMFTTAEEIIQVPEKQVKEVLNEPAPAPAPVKKIRKNFKVSKNLANVVQASELEKKQTRVMPEVIATNKFLVDRNKKSKRIQHFNSLPEEKDKSAFQDLEADQEEDDFFIDAYKNTNRLFAACVEQESHSLAELTQDSDPVDTESKFS